MATAFQANAFQNDAFQIDTAFDPASNPSWLPVYLTCMIQWMGYDVVASGVIFYRSDS